MAERVAVTHFLTGVFLPKGTTVLWDVRFFSPNFSDFPSRVHNNHNFKNCGSNKLWVAVGGYGRLQGDHPSVWVLASLASNARPVRAQLSHLREALKIGVLFWASNRLYQSVENRIWDKRGMQKQEKVFQFEIKNVFFLCGKTRPFAKD